MAPPLSTSVPAKLTAGETWNWTHQFPDFPISEGWGALKIEIRGIGTLDISGNPKVTNDGTTWTVLTDRNFTKDLAAGQYRWWARVTGTGVYNGQERIAASGTVVIAADPTQAVAGAYQSENEQVLLLIRQEIKARVPGSGVAHVSRAIDGESLQLVPLEELRNMERDYAQRVYSERHGGRIGPDVAFSL